MKQKEFITALNLVLADATHAGDFGWGRTGVDVEGGGVTTGTGSLVTTPGSATAGAAGAVINVNRFKKFV